MTPLGLMINFRCTVLKPPFSFIVVQGHVDLFAVKTYKTREYKYKRFYLDLPGRLVNFLKGFWSFLLIRSRTINPAQAIDDTTIAQLFSAVNS